jgi:hypothetical protein
MRSDGNTLVTPESTFNVDGAPPVPADRGRAFPIPLWAGLLIAAAFVLHSSNYLYFFVDDEAIPYVYAQNVLNGKGLVYNSFEGRAEGYSNFLHVCVATVILAGVRLLQFSKLMVFAVGKVGSLVCGAGLVFVTFLTLRRLPQVHRSGVVSGLAFMGLAGPLALWSCSSLETATFGFLIALLLYSIVAQASGQPLGWMAAACAAAALLMRIDGFVYVGAIAGGALLFAEPSRRKDIWAAIVRPSVAVFVMYQVWRILYFRELLSVPLYAKVLYKLQPHANLVTKPPAQNYAVAFFEMYGAVPMSALCLAGSLWDRKRIALASVTSAVSLVAYLTIVGDWMFGFRFFVPVLPLLALLIASSISAITARARVIGWVMMAVCILWFGSVAYAFGNSYVQIERQQSWLLHPSLDPTRHFSRYYSLVEESRPYMHSGDRIAYNQSGFLSFMLDLDNIDDLGICSKFYAKLPTTDVFFTEVGRYEPVTDKPVFRAGEAYLLYREPRFLVVPEDLLHKANMNRIPEEVLGGFYRILFRDSSHNNIVYARTERTVAEFKTQRWRFLENLVHVSYLKAARINGVPVPTDQLQRRFPWLRDEGARFTVSSGSRVDLEFADRDEAIYEAHVDQLLATRPLSIVLTLQSCTGRVSYQQTIDLAANSSRDFRDHLPVPIGACRLALEVAGVDQDAARLEIHDLRIQGQTRELAEYIRNNLIFPAP